jgi:hypothetical protein
MDESNSSKQATVPQRHFKLLSLFKVLSGGLFGLIVPLLLIWSSSQTVTKMVSDMNEDANLTKGHAEVYQLLESYDINPDHGNLYAFTSYLIAQQTNEKVIKKKTLLKAMLMQLGLVIVSIGLLFVVLGFKEGGVDGSASGISGIDFNITIGSTGLATIFFGVLMITLGGVVSNKFTTVGVPKYSHQVVSANLKRGQIAISQENLLKELENCRMSEIDYVSEKMSVFVCIDRAFSALYKEEEQ